jgi:tetratricopeptide (TPR) repeat protein
MARTTLRTGRRVAMKLPVSRTVGALPRLLMALFGLALGACSTLPAPPQPVTAHLLHDGHYPLAAAPADRDAVFEFSPAMRAYANAELNAAARLRDPRQALLDALYRQDKLRLRYDAGPTRNAAQAFEARAGNCLSLVIMTAAFARHLGVPVSYQSVQVEDTYSRSGGLVLVSHHVNLVLGRRIQHSMFAGNQNDDMTVDFLPPDQLRGQRTQPLDERTVLAMYFNNRAAEALAEDHGGQSAQNARSTGSANSQAYAWAREALRQDPAFLPAINTLAVVYLRDGHLAEAEGALRHVLAQAPLSISTLSNLALLLERRGQTAEALAVRQRLAQLQPDSPFVLFDQAQQAMARGDYALARELFQRELRRQPDQPDVLLGAAQAEWRLGDAQRAAGLLQQALAHSRSARARDLYAGKLAWLREQSSH